MSYIGRQKLRKEANAWNFLKKPVLCMVGYFRPLLSGEEWVAVEDAHYQRGCTRCVEEVCRLLKEQGDYEELLRLCGRAASLYPFDEWQIWQVDGLMALGRLRESAELYERTVDLYREEFPVQPPEQMSHCLRRMEARMRTETEDLHQIREYLREKGAGAGAYYCSCPGRQLIFFCAVFWMRERGVRPGRTVFRKCRKRLRIL
ncbi:MAG: hypothetical protein HFI15_11115 [Lachnospiraceae bacterium]|nr:hypothetical protein [Lachnospiraceae bacterium]